jgi:myo-inositol-1(or 4)-monophosphatase
MDLKAIEKSVVAICREVGEFIKKEGSSFDRSRIEFKDVSNNLVSYVDKEAERVLVKKLGELLPEAGFITEEDTVSNTLESEYAWIIDPLDGTTNFLHGLPVFAISVALTHHDEPILGVVLEINNNECFHSSKGSPAYCNDKIIKVSPIDSLTESLLATGFPYYHMDKIEEYLDIIREFLDKSHGIRRLGSAAVDLAYVACGRLEGFFEYDLNPWDVAAGAFIVKQAGGKVTDFKGGNNYLHGGELIAGGSVHAEMLEIIRKMWGYP